MTALAFFVVKLLMQKKPKEIIMGTVKRFPSFLLLSWHIAYMGSSTFSNGKACAKEFHVGKFYTSLGSFRQSRGEETFLHFTMESIKILWQYEGGAALNIVFSYGMNILSFYSRSI